ncbi:hypothetical protein [Agrobacterium sp.]|uniref:hypothetical protein n=1 Tax=Agrobacterium sp. TaxID=361 RepID=UPI004034A595
MSLYYINLLLSSIVHFVHILIMLVMLLQMRGKELHALEPKHFTKVVVADTPPGFKFVVDPFACKNHQGGLRGANNPPDSKEVVPNSNTIRMGNQLAEAKVRRDCSCWLCLCMSSSVMLWQGVAYHPLYGFLFFSELPALVQIKAWLA